MRCGQRRSGSTGHEDSQARAKLQCECLPDTTVRARQGREQGETSRQVRHRAHMSRTLRRLLSGALRV